MDLIAFVMLHEQNDLRLAKKPSESLTSMHPAFSN